MFSTVAPSYMEHTAGNSRLYMCLHFWKDAVRLEAALMKITFSLINLYIGLILFLTGSFIHLSIPPSVRSQVEVSEEKIHQRSFRESRGPPEPDELHNPSGKFWL